MNISRDQSKETIVSVVIPTFGRPEMLRDALESLERQTRRPDEVIVVDDGSPEPLGKVPTTLNLRIIRQDNTGGAGAVNRGVAESVGDLVFFLDDDDLYAPNRISHAVEAHKTSDVVCCSMTEFVDVVPSNSSMYLAADQHQSRTNGEASCLKVSRLLRRTTPSFGTLSLKRELYIPLNESYRACHDIEWWIRFSAEGRSLVMIPAADYMVRRHPGVRHLSGADIRAEMSKRLLREHEAFFESDRRAKSFRHARISLLLGSTGDTDEALTYARRAVFAFPTRAACYAVLLAVREKAATCSRG